MKQSNIPEHCHFCIIASKAIWGDDADEFRPERFLPENMKKVPSFAFLPFARGPRNYIGERYAMMQLKVFLSHFFRNFKVSTELKIEDMTFQFGLAIKLNQLRVENCKREILKNKTMMDKVLELVRGFIC